MIDELRIGNIMEILSKKKHATNEYLAKQLHCSNSTLRRTLIEMETTGLIKRTWGGAMLSSLISTEYSHNYRETLYLEEKKNIASLAADFVGSGMSIYLDASSTVYQITPYLKDKTDLIILTNSLKSAYALTQDENSSNKVFILGGEINNKARCVVDSISNNAIINYLDFDLAIFSCRGILDMNVYEAKYEQALLKRKMMEKSKEVILLADHTKFGTKHHYKVASLADYTSVITDSKLEIYNNEELIRKNVDLICYDN